MPVNSLNEPRTLVTIACRATKPIRLWLGSSVYSPVCRAEVVEAVITYLRFDLVDTSTLRLTWMTCQLFRYAQVTMTDARWLSEGEQHAWRGYLAMNTQL